jgi:hypothetical protein
MKGEGVPVSAFFRECLSTGTPQQKNFCVPTRNIDSRNRSGAQD